MIIKADKEARVAIEQLCDIALKAGGLSNMNGIGNILKSVEDIESEEPNGGQDGAID